MFLKLSDDLQIKLTDYTPSSLYYHYGDNQSIVSHDTDDGFTLK